MICCVIRNLKFCCRLIFCFIAYKNIAASMYFFYVLDSKFPNRVSVNITVCSY